jgi:hypothetical protein
MWQFFRIELAGSIAMASRGNKILDGFLISQVILLNDVTTQVAS